MNKDVDYSMFTYFKGEGKSNYKNRKEKHFGSLEQTFHENYKGKPADKEQALKDYISHYLSQKAGDNAGTLSVYKERFKKFVRLYLEKDFVPPEWLSE